VKSLRFSQKALLLYIQERIQEVYCTRLVRGKEGETLSKVIRTEKPSVLPIYAAALVWILGCILLPIYKLWALLLTAALSGACHAIAKGVCPPRVVEHEVPFHTGSGDVDEMLVDIQSKLDTLHTLNDSLPDAEMTAAMTRMEKAGRAIVEAVEANPSKAKQVRRFANYYLPDAVNVLQQYATMARQGVRGENAASIRAEVEHNVSSIATAFENQLDALYATESMDLSADLTVLQSMLKGQGLSK
jgi:ketosteroid isomerase-like protein